MNRTAMGIVGGLVGAAAGAGLFVLLLTAGLYTGLLPGAGAGVGAAIARAKGPLVPIMAGVFGLIAAVLAEAYAMPFQADESLGFFLRNFTRVEPFHLLFMAVGVACAIWIPWRESPRAAPAS